jgi:hypothetical protein
VCVCARARARVKFLCVCGGGGGKREGDKADAGCVPYVYTHMMQYVSIHIQARRQG